MKENKGVSLTGFVITILVILLAVAVAGCVYLLKNPVKEQAAVQNPVPVTNLNSSNEEKETKITTDEKLAENSNGMKKIQMTDNFKEYDEDKYHFITRSVQLRYGDDTEYSLVYAYSGENKGKLKIGSYESLEKMVDVKISKPIKNIQAFATAKEYKDKKGNLELRAEDIAYILFEDGTIGKISSKDIHNKDYKITMLENIKNIEYIIEFGITAPMASGGSILYGIDNNGKAIFIDGDIGLLTNEE